MVFQKNKIRVDQM